jgi:hypothetical protein
VCTDAVALASYINANQDSLKPWNPPAGGTTATHSLPRIVYVPPVVAKFLIEKERTAFQLYKFLGEVTRASDSFLEEQHVELLKVWAMAAGQYAMGTTSHKIAIIIIPVMSVAPNFTAWLLRQMKSYLEGPSKNNTPQASLQTPQQQQQQQIHHGGTANMLVQSVTRVLETITEKQAANMAEAEKNAAQGKALTPHRRWRLCVVSVASRIQTRGPRFTQS